MSQGLGKPSQRGGGQRALGLNGAELCRPRPMTRPTPQAAGSRGTKAPGSRRLVFQTYAHPDGSTCQEDRLWRSQVPGSQRHLEEQAGRCDSVLGSPVWTLDPGREASVFRWQRERGQCDEAGAAERREERPAQSPGGGHTHEGGSDKGRSGSHAWKTARP